MEYLDVYDANGNKLNKTIVRGKEKESLFNGENIKLTVVWLQCKDRFLIQKTSGKKGNVYAVTGGHVPAGCTTRSQAVVEAWEELGIFLQEEELYFLGMVKLNERVAFDVYHYRNDMLDAFTFALQTSEVESVAWYTKTEIEEMILHNVLRRSSAMQYNAFIKNKI